MRKRLKSWWAKANARSLNEPSFVQMVAVVLVLVLIAGAFRLGQYDGAQSARDELTEAHHGEMTAVTTELVQTQGKLAAANEELYAARQELEAWQNGTSGECVELGEAEP